VMSLTLSLLILHSMIVHLRRNSESDDTYTQLIITCEEIQASRAVFSNKVASCSLKA
jgi:hypothetical protein